jgi:hypothetical protein
MLRASLIVSLCLMLSASSALAETTLPPGKPAGVQGAQANRYYGAIAVGALVLIAIGGYAITTAPYQIPASAAAATSTQP